MVYLQIADLYEAGKTGGMRTRCASFPSRLLLRKQQKMVPPEMIPQEQLERTLTFRLTAKQNTFSSLD